MTTVSPTIRPHLGRVPRLLVLRKGDHDLRRNWFSLVEELPDRERGRILAFRDREDAISSLVARSLMIELAAEALHCPESDIRIERGPLGKPFVAAPAPNDLDVNATHAGGWVAAVVARGGRIGVDLEGVRAVAPGLIERCLSDFERSRFAHISAMETDSRFFQLWTAKEAYLKATGFGLSMDPREIVIDLTSDGQPVLHAGASEQWRFRSWNPTPEVWLTVCCERDVPVDMEFRECAS